MYNNTHTKHNTVAHWPKNGDERIDAFRSIVRTGQYAKVDGGLIDMQSAKAVLHLYDRLNDKNQHKYKAQEAFLMAKIAWDILGVLK